MRARIPFAGFTAIAGMLLLSGCVLLLGESFVEVDLYNPVTQERATCGPGGQRGGPSREQLAEMGACVSEHEARGFRPSRPDDPKPSPLSR